MPISVQLTCNVSIIALMACSRQRLTLEQLDVLRRGLEVTGGLVVHFDVVHGLSKSIRIVKLARMGDPARQEIISSLYMYRVRR